jgi:hypothetical protein
LDVGSYSALENQVGNDVAELSKHTTTPNITCWQWLEVYQQAQRRVSIEINVLAS